MTKVDRDQTVEIDTVDHHIEVDVNMEKFRERSQCSKLQRKFWDSKF